MAVVPVVAGRMQRSLPPLSMAISSFARRATGESACDNWGTRHVRTPLAGKISHCFAGLQEIVRAFCDVTVERLCAG